MPYRKTDRKAPSAGVEFEPIEVARFWKNRAGEAVIVRLHVYKGRPLIDVRTWWTAKDGTLKPGKGFASSARLLPEIAKALSTAEAKAAEIGLIGGADAQRS